MRHSTHLNAAGHYMYVESSYPRAEGDVAKLRSLQFPMSGYDCRMELAYHMRGDHIGTLAVEVQAARGSEVRMIYCSKYCFLK